MRYGGHETFTIREGWLSKALTLLEKDPGKFFDKVDLANALGVGVNMGKSIEHWLLATKLVTKIPLQEIRKEKKEKKYNLTELGSIIHEHDPYMTLEETWWLLHINMVQNPEYSATWDWFFNDFTELKFDKSRIIQKIMAKEKTLSSRPPSQNTIERDVSCFLNTYAQTIPRGIKDPEEEYVCPFTELQLMIHQKNSGSYELNRKPRKLRPEIFLYSLNTLLGDEIKPHDVTLSWLSKQRSGPIQTLCLTSEGLFDLALESQNTLEKQYNYSIRSLAGDRQIVYTNPGNSELLSTMYEELA